MKKLIIGAAFAALLVAPAAAQSYDPDLGTGNVLNVPAAERGGYYAGNAERAYGYAQVPSRARGARAQALSPNGADTVYENGHYVGQDPDPNVRLELRRDGWIYN